MCTSVTNTTHQNRTVTSDGCVHVQHAQQGMSKCVIVCVGVLSMSLNDSGVLVCYLILLLCVRVIVTIMH